LAQKKSKGTPLKLFSGKQAKLNRIIMLILSSKALMTKYDIFLEIRSMKGFRHKNSKTIYRRIEALAEEGWIAKNGTRPGKVQGTSVLYEATLKGKAALKLDEKNIERFLKTATEEQLTKFIDLY
jgi:DNA-binding PadR family transcriptional regulator